MSAIKSVHLSNRKLSKMARRIREEEEAKVMGVELPKPQPANYLDFEGKKMFEKFVELHNHLSEADSEDLSQLCQYIVLHRKAVERIDELDILSGEYGKHLTQIVKLDKLINGYMVQLCLTYRERLRLANELAKLRIEEEKLKTMNGAQQQEENPLLDLLKEVEEM
ncbi:hypothetical protein C3496_12315 [Bacillus anthracis]|uniref:hypothetical protein n=1 Tax=Bacillus TaxID=1386 RepID=UPI0010A5E2CA|nr:MULTISPECIES: hypothetical protein [Bacillus]QBJ67106.1 hypothetical protein C3496_12315 [Bacillus anthracis]THG62627.1 hypothetical protein E7Y01_02390 [Bacillus sp. HUB-I-004]